MRQTISLAVKGKSSCGKKAFALLQVGNFFAARSLLFASKL